MPNENAPFELYAKTIHSEDGQARTLYCYTINPSSGLPNHLCGGVRTTGCSTRTAAEVFVRQRITELQRGRLQTFPLTDCSSLLGDSTQLRTAAAQKGSLFFRALLPAADLLKVRHDLLTVMRKHGALAEGSDPDSGIAREGVVFEGSNPTEEYKRYSNDVLGVRSFNALAHHQRLVGVMEQLIGAPLLIHPRHICHAIFPGQEVFKAPPHQDFQAIRGTPDTWTVWLPFGDLDEQLGGVNVAEGSHTKGLLPTQEGMLWVEPDPDERWLWGPMQTGDVLMFHSHTVHQGRENTSGNRLRLAGSYRYQMASDPVDEGALLPQHRYGDWDELYADWPQDDPLRYYWRSLELNVQPAYRRP